MLLSKNRYLELDFARIMAILLMIQGHSIGTFVNQENISNLGFLGEVWNHIRSVTSSTFLIVSGIVNFIGVKRNEDGIISNTILKKRLIRGLLLILVDYILIFPVINIFQLNKLTSSDWFNFFKVGTLNIIGISLIFLVLFLKFSKDDRNIIKNLLVTSVLMIILTPIIQSFPWFSYLHPYFAHYLTQSGGSFFSITTHTPYLFIGFILGFLFFKNNPNITNKEILKILIFGLILAIIGRIFFNFIEPLIFPEMKYYSSASLIIFKLGLSLILISIYFYISKYLKNYGFLIKTLSSKNLTTYVLHIIIIFGTPWSLGLNYYFSNESITIGLFLSLIVSISIFIIVYSLAIINSRYLRFNYILNIALILTILYLILFQDNKIKFI